MISRTQILLNPRNYHDFIGHLRENDKDILHILNTEYSAMDIDKLNN